jgi:two-component system, LytTR family, response regulator
MKCILVDDEILNLKNLEIILNENFPEAIILGKFQSVLDAKLYLESNSIDLLFLDVSMPIEDGFDLLSYFPKRNFKTIFVTAHEEYAIKAIRAGAIDYILKPILISELKTAIENVKSVLSSNEYNKQDTITINYEGGKSIVALKDILYLKGFDNLTTFYLTKNRKITVSKTLKHFEEVLQNNFFRIHKSFLVNLNFASKILSRESFYLELNEGTQLPISRRNYKPLNDILKK